MGEMYNTAINVPVKKEGKESIVNMLTQLGEALTDAHATSNRIHNAIFGNSPELVDALETPPISCMADDVHDKVLRARRLADKLRAIEIQLGI